MSFEGIFGRDVALGDLGKDRYLRCYRERTHISNAVLDTYSNAIQLAVGRFHKGAYQNASDVRYIAATNMSYDLLTTVYDVNTKSILACRTFGFDESARVLISKYINSLKKSRPNLEVRLIGLQSRQNADYLGKIADLMNKTGAKLVEVDLFGDNTRHIAIDKKLGTSHDVLLENRLYRAGELTNMTTLEQFERALRH